MGRVKRLFLSEMPCHRSQESLGVRVEQVVKPPAHADVWKHRRRGTETSAQARKEQVTA